MGEIKSMYKEYFQKSKIFLYPALEIKRGGGNGPMDTFVSWNGHYTPEDMKLMCLYNLRNDLEFKSLEKYKLLGNKLFYDFKQLEDNKGVYIFDFTKYKHDWECFLQGKYSRMSDTFKKIIKNWVGELHPSMPYIESFLHPEKYYRIYSEIINVEESILKEVGELGNIPDMEKENLIMTIKNLDYHK